jgi:hypothetical protein
MKFRVVTKSFVNPESWVPDRHVRLEAPSLLASPPQVSRTSEPSGCLAAGLFSENQLMLEMDGFRRSVTTAAGFPPVFRVKV